MSDSGRLPAVQNSTTSPAAIGCEADITLTLFTDDLRRNGAPDPGAAKGKFTFPKLIIDPVCHATAILKGPFLIFF